MEIKKIKSILRFEKKSEHQAYSKDYSELKSKVDEEGDPKKIFLMGTPNVGKSMLFNQLTGAYVTVSNYPGTTVTVDRGVCKISAENFEIWDSPGMYSLCSITEEERISKLILLEEKSYVLLHVVDAKNLERMLPMTLQLIEANLPVILVLNMMDEAEKHGIKIEHSEIERKLGIPVITTTAASGKGLDKLKKEISDYNHYLGDGFKVKYNETIESALKKISSLIKGEYSLSKRSLSLMLLQQDEDVEKIIKSDEVDHYEDIQNVVKKTASHFSQPLNYLVKLRLQKEATDILSPLMEKKEIKDKNWGDKLSRLMINPITGIPILLVIIYLGLYQFVGVWGAGELVDLIESTIFGEWINPLVTNFVVNNVPYMPIQELLVGEYGIWTLGVTYATAIILPIVGTFFLVFSVMEDSGYLPRLAMLINRVFNLIGLSGRAVIPMVLGLGCGSMATMVTRTLETPGKGPYPPYCWP